LSAFLGATKRLWNQTAVDIFFCIFCSGIGDCKGLVYKKKKFIYDNLMKSLSKKVSNLSLGAYPPLAEVIDANRRAFLLDDDLLSAEVIDNKAADTGK